MSDPTLFDQTPIPPLDPRISSVEAPRLSRQCHAILDRLRRGRATNRELVAIAINHTGRISECRRVGHDIRVVDEDRKTGYAQYALFVAGREYKAP
jgi:hypothetical protein